MLTIFTPVYNRSYILGKLYESLLDQTSKEFEWVIVDDGSTDEVASLVEGWIDEGNIDIRFFRQENGGKHRAINRGVAEARGELFFIVDSDDHLTPDAVEWVNSKGEEIINNSAFAGLSGLRIHPDGSKVGGEQHFNQIDADAIEIRVQYGIIGDLAEIYKTEVLRRFPFPDIPGECFCSEGLVWNRIACAGLRLRYWHHGIYVCEYLADGLTASRINCRTNSPEYSMLLYSELIKNPSLGVKEVCKYAILFWRYSEKSQKNLRQKSSMIGYKYLCFWPLGVAMRKLTR